MNFRNASGKLKSQAAPRFGEELCIGCDQKVVYLDIVQGAGMFPPVTLRAALCIPVPTLLDPDAWKEKDFESLTSVTYFSLTWVLSGSAKSDPQLD